MIAEKQNPKARFSTKLPSGDFLGITIWPGRSDPNAEIVAVQIRRQSGEGWETVARMALYRTQDGRYSLLPERTPTPESKRAEPIPVGASAESQE